MTNHVAVGAFDLNLIGETNESGNPFRVLFANDFVKRIAAHLPSGILLVRNDHGLNLWGGPLRIYKSGPHPAATDLARRVQNNLATKLPVL